MSYFTANCYNAYDAGDLRSEFLFLHLACNLTWPGVDPADVYEVDSKLFIRIGSGQMDYAPALQACPNGWNLPKMKTTADYNTLLKVIGESVTTGGRTRSWTSEAGPWAERLIGSMKCSRSI